MKAATLRPSTPRPLGPFHCEMWLRIARCSCTPEIVRLPRISKPHFLAGFADLVVMVDSGPQVRAMERSAKTTNGQG